MNQFLPATIILLLALLGLNLSLAMGGVMNQPNWALAILLAAILARRGSWPWALPGLLIHDLMLQWSIWGVFPFAACLLFVLYHVDANLGPALPQRLAVLALASLPVIWLGGSIQWLLTLMLCLPLWHALVIIYARPA